jgi:nitroreductase
MANAVEKTLSRAIAERRASPSFDESPIPDADLMKILQAGLQAPSGYNLQPWRFIVVRSQLQPGQGGRGLGHDCGVRRRGWVA